MAGLKSVKKGLRRRHVRPGRAGRKPDEEVVKTPDMEGPPQAVEEQMPEDTAAVKEGQGVWEDAHHLVYDHLDDVPAQHRQVFRKRARAPVPWEETLEPSDERSLKRVRTTDFANYVLMAVAEGTLLGCEVRGNEWLSRMEVEKLGEVLDLPVSSVRLHRAPRKRLQPSGRPGGKARLTVMFGQEPDQAMLVQETATEMPLFLAGSLHVSS